MKTFFIHIFILASFAACKEKDGFARYKALEKKELVSGNRADSLFFGIYLGMTSQQFYNHCWDLNKKGIFTDGDNNTAVLYPLKNNELNHPASMNFYPDFINGKIVRMRVTFRYNAWAPWNKHLYSDSLQPDVLRLYKKWYNKGNPFISISDKNNRTLYVKVDGNRRIIIGRYDDVIVKVDYADLLVGRQSKK